MKVTLQSCLLAICLLPAAWPGSAECQPRGSSAHRLSISVADSATHAPLLGSQVLVSSRHLSFIVPESGVVTFDLVPPVNDTIIVRRLGYFPVVMTVSLKPSQSTSLLVLLDPVPQLLPEVSIENTVQRGLIRNGFFDRRTRSNGYFVGPEQIATRKPARLSDLLADDPQVRFFDAASGGRYIRFTRAENCSPLVYVDGVLVVNERPVSRGKVVRGTLHSNEASNDVLSQQDQGIDEISVRQVAAVEAYSSSTQAPPQYSAIGAACGILLVWTASFFEHSQ